MHSAKFVKKQKLCETSGGAGPCDLLICDEAHRLKNADTATTQALALLSCRRRVLLTGTPLQNNLDEFHAMADFANPQLFGGSEVFRRGFANPILRGKEPDASDGQKEKGRRCQAAMSNLTNQFILRRTNMLNAEHLPPKLVQVVCCRMTPCQEAMYRHVLEEKETAHLINGQQKDVLGYIQKLGKICSHPSLVCNASGAGSSVAASGKDKAAAREAAELALYLPDGSGGVGAGGGAGRGGRVSSRGAGPREVHPEWSGKMVVLHALMRTMRLKGSERIVVISIYTSTLDVIHAMCEANGWPSVRLDGSTSVKKRMDLVNVFNDEAADQFAFLLSSRAGGCVRAGRARECVCAARGRGGAGGGPRPPLPPSSRARVAPRSAGGPSVVAVGGWPRSSSALPDATTAVRRADACRRTVLCRVDDHDDDGGAWGRLGVAAWRGATRRDVSCRVVCVSRQVRAEPDRREPARSVRPRLEPSDRQAGGRALLARRPEAALLHVPLPHDGHARGAHLPAPALEGGPPERRRGRGPGVVTATRRRAKRSARASPLGGGGDGEIAER